MFKSFISVKNISPKPIWQYCGHPSVRARAGGGRAVAGRGGGTRDRGGRRVLGSHRLGVRHATGGHQPSPAQPSPAPPPQLWCPGQNGFLSIPGRAAEDANQPRGSAVGGQTGRRIYIVLCEPHS